MEIWLYQKKFENVDKKSITFHQHLFHALILEHMYYIIDNLNALSI